MTHLALKAKRLFYATVLCPSQLDYYTIASLKELKKRARSKGMRLKYSEGLIKDAKPIAGEDEESVFAALGLPCPPPTEREIRNSEPVWMPHQGT